MPRLILAAERLVLARALIQKAHEVPLPADGGKYEFSYIAQVKDLLRQARDLVKFIPQSAGASAEIKADALRVIREADQADQEILH
ncbi:MAG: hypothetical protein NTW32_07485 [Chloroflexi bacterium]|nr:hypothetical protein [Chloroflexota bacterium]